MNKTKRRSAIVVITSVLLLAVLALATGIASVDSHSVSVSQESPASLGDWNGTWVNVGTMLDDPAWDAVYEAIADVANAAAGMAPLAPMTPRTSRTQCLRQISAI